MSPSLRRATVRQQTQSERRLNTWSSRKFPSPSDKLVAAAVTLGPRRTTVYVEYLPVTWPLCKLCKLVAFFCALVCATGSSFAAIRLIDRNSRSVASRPLSASRDYARAQDTNQCKYCGALGLWSFGPLSAARSVLSQKRRKLLRLPAAQSTTEHMGKIVTKKDTVVPPQALSRASGFGGNRSRSGQLRRFVSASAEPRR
jgi:hypothetical protein